MRKRTSGTKLGATSLFTSFSQSRDENQGWLFTASMPPAGTVPSLNVVLRVIIYRHRSMLESLFKSRKFKTYLK